MNDKTPILLWFRRDLRTHDHPALLAAVETGRPIVPVFVHDPLVEDLGAAPMWRLGLGLESLAHKLETLGSRLIFRRGPDALKVLRDLARETGAGAVYWTRLYDPRTIDRDKRIKATLTADGLKARSFGGHLLFEPWTVETKTGGFYRVYTPFWNSVRERDVAWPRPAPTDLVPPASWPASDKFVDWQMGAKMNRGTAVVRPYVQLGEAAALSRLHTFVQDGVADYKINRDFPDRAGTSNLSENLGLGEISPHQCWHAGQRARQEGAEGAETFLKELVWREFAYHLMYHTPHILTRNWRQEWDGFAWINDPGHPHVLAWKQGRTGIPFVDAAMRELYVTGRMHNRARMIAACYLTKHLLIDWRIGLKWFEECLIDWDPASNAMGWQWSAGCGPDAAPFFRVFNPETQLEKFDHDQLYVGKWLAEGRENPASAALSFYQAIPRKWGLSAQDPYPHAVVSAREGRKRALEAYENRGF